MIDFRSLVKAGVHFGHQKNRWCPRMAPYIWGTKNNIHLIDVSKTAFLLEQAASFLKGVASQGLPILWVGTKKAAKDAVIRAGVDLGMPYVSHRWIGGTLSNFGQVKKSVTRCLHFEDILSKSEQFPHYTKKELNVFQKIVGRLDKNVGGIKKLTWPVGALVVVDVFKEHSAVKEAVAMGVPVVALVDTNCDPSNISYVIPANDDAPRAVNVVFDYLIAAAREGKDIAQASGKVQVHAVEQVDSVERTDYSDLLEDEKIVEKEVVSTRGRSAGNAEGSERDHSSAKKPFSKAPRNPSFRKGGKQ